MIYFSDGKVNGWRTNNTNIRLTTDDSIVKITYVIIVRIFKEEVKYNAAEDSLSPIGYFTRRLYDYAKKRN
jgi:hypothetical protein